MDFSLFEIGIGNGTFEIHICEFTLNSWDDWHYLFNFSFFKGRVHNLSILFIKIIEC